MAPVQVDKAGGGKALVLEEGGTPAAHGMVLVEEETVEGGDKVLAQEDKVLVPEDKVARDKATAFSLDKVVRLPSDTRVYEDLHTFWLGSQIDWNTFFRIWDAIRENFVLSTAKDLLTLVGTSKEYDSVLSVFVFQIDYN